jgi:hypothetical protein
MGTLKDNRGGVVGSGAYVGRTKWARAYYDFATDAGAVGAINLRGDKIPSGAVIVNSIVNVQTLVTGGAGATVSLGLETATDLRAASTLTTAPALDTTGNKLLSMTSATAPAALTADRHVVATIAVNALTAGRFSVLVAYIELDPSF